MKYLINICCCLLLCIQSLPLYAQQVDYKNTKEKVYLHTSHVFFTPGEELFYKIYVVNAQDLQPNRISKRVFVEVISPAGSVVEKQQYEVAEGYAQGSFVFGKDAPGGIYTLRAYTLWMRNEKPRTVFNREITLLKVISPRVLMKLDFPRKGYGPGDEVAAEYSMKNLQQQPIVGFPAQYTVSIDGKAVFTGTFTTDTAGKARILFRLPEKLYTNDGLLNITVDYQHNKEAISRSIPITLNKIDLQFMPEGGTLVNGIATNMAFKAINEYGKPADVKGTVLDDQGKQVATFESLRFGMGAFRFTPQPGHHYIARLSAPAGARGEYVLPAAATNGVVMNVRRKDSLLQFVLQASQPMTVTLEGKTRNVTHYKQVIQLQAGEQVVSVNPADFPVGIAVFTIAQLNNIPLAERIVFLGASRCLQVKITPDKQLYKPREKVTLDISTTGEKGMPIPANLSLAVVDDKKWVLADDRQDNILSWLLLSSELHGKTEEPSFYFKQDEPTAPAAQDLLMLTNGYRYFDYEDAVIRNNQLLHGPDAVHVLSGIVMDKNERPVPSKVYFLHGTVPGQKIRMIETDEAGRFKMTGLTPDRYMLVAVPKRKVREKTGDVIRILENKFIAGGDVSKFAAPLTDTVAGYTTGQEEQALPPQSNPSQKPVAPKEMFMFPESDKALQEVVVTGYSIAQKKSMTSAIVSTVSMERLQSVSTGLQGFVAGIAITPNTQGNDYNVTLRGARSASGSNEPLYIYNGVPVTSAEIAGNLGLISSVTVLKDAAAVALYGSRAVNGVVVINGVGTWGEYRKVNLSPNYNLPFAMADVQGEAITPVRRFYAPVYTSLKTKERNDFRETIYWNPVVQTDRHGKAVVSFYNSDATTSFRAIAEGIGYNGQPGRTEIAYVSKAPVGVDVKIPPYLTVGDKALLPMVISNNTPDEMELDITMVLPKGMKAGNYESRVLLPGNGSYKILLPVEAIARLEDDIHFVVQMPQGQENITLPVTVSEKGFPASICLSAAAPESWNFPLKNIVPGSLRTELSLYEELEGLTMEVIASMLREPYGCFEQTSSTTYPNIFILKYLQQTGKLNPALKKKAMNYLERGYNRLRSFETSAGGFEWFGHVPPQEALTAYGLMEFTDMKEFIAVDEGMMARTKKFLLGRRNGTGGFRLEASKSHQLHAVPYSVANTYIVYAMTKAGMGLEILPEYEAALKTAMKSNSAWELAVMANAAYYMKRPEDYRQLIILLQQGYRNNTLDKGSVVGASGASLDVETMAWYGLALVKDNNNIVELSHLMQKIMKYRTVYGFGATQSTVLTLELLTAYANAVSRAKASYSTAFTLNQSQVSPGPVDATLLKEGENVFTATAKDSSGMGPYSLEVMYNTLLPDNSAAAVLKLQTALSSTQAKVGETVRMNMQVKNETNKGLPMSVAKIGIPAGLSAQPWQLKELIETKKITHYEIFDNYLVLYWLDFAPGENKIVNLDLKAEIPGTYKGKAGNVYLYYTPEHKHWNAGLDIDIRE
ncbi:TonB-dependent receptor plug domain-containing protein [Chitinophaga sp. G-6-1-13]|uniref:TonB-dependent receptor plug domain-containing protein n=1 Tax=Chitinophaga fulva TaxID=2728842 RepID=A0A848GK55_9BACT|nr:alpha-2-macroglobulin family protein [Chitinophaga fulva]NML38995.1 TonB-dependent receptor plug domain-containing protein [Chitinophaga fulva]